MSAKTIQPKDSHKLDQTENGINLHKSPDIKKLIPVRVSPKTTIYFKPGKDLELRIANWKHNHRNCVY